MRTRITLSTFRFVDRQQEQMARAMMPRIDAADPEDRNRAIAHQGVGACVAVGPNGTRLVRSSAGLTATMAEVARG